jgi:hypothetical protein
MNVGGQAPESHNNQTSNRHTPHKGTKTDNSHKDTQPSPPRLLAPPARTRSRSSSLPAPVQAAQLLQSLTSPTTANTSAASRQALTAASSARLANESDALERLKMRKYYYRRLVDPHTLFDRSYLPGEHTLLNRTKCIGISMPNADICVISGTLVVTNFRVIFDPTSSDFLKVRVPPPHNK